jgi:RES domain-containing protein
LTSIFRISSARFPADSGEGAALFGGRWNSGETEKIDGTPVIYAAQSASLAVLEILVHYTVLPKEQVLTEIVLPDHLQILAWLEIDLPRGWNNANPIPETQRMGDKWVKSGVSAILSVPSSIIPRERNFILNPAHPAFSEIVFLPSTPILFDSRLKP